LRLLLAGFVAGASVVPLVTLTRVIDWRGGVVAVWQRCPKWLHGQPGAVGHPSKLAAHRIPS
jgi:hypothetical protein